MQKLLYLEHFLTYRYALLFTYLAFNYRPLLDWTMTCHKVVNLILWANIRRYGSQILNLSRIFIFLYWLFRWVFIYSQIKCWRMFAHPSVFYGIILDYFVWDMRRSYFIPNYFFIFNRIDKPISWYSGFPYWMVKFVFPEWRFIVRWSFRKVFVQILPFVLG
jgi:hypothetical protein